MLIYLFSVSLIKIRTSNNAIHCHLADNLIKFVMSTACVTKWCKCWIQTNINKEDKDFLLSITIYDYNQILTN